MKRISLIGTALLFLLVWTPGASAVPYSFTNITNNNPGDAGIGEAQLRLDVTYVNGSQVLFTFSNTGPAASSITDIYFDDDVPLLDFNSFIYPTSGVAFTVGASPSNLPGGNDPLYHFSSNYDYDSANPVQPKGVNPGESLGILFDYENGFSYGDILAALNAEDMRIGIHVQGFATGGSEAYINTVPEPATMLLLGCGLVGLIGFGRKRFGKGIPA